MKLLARPITATRLLIQIAQLLPQFRNISFSWQTPPDPVQLDKKYVVTLEDAWKALELLPPPGRMQTTLMSCGKNFKQDCSRGFSTHAEVQLLLRNEAFPKSKPTLDYIGCSKKSCLLCKAFLQISPLRAKIRGRHGGCCPAWGVSPAHLGRLSGRLTHLSKLLKQRLLEELVSRGVTLHRQIPQSIIVSDLIAWTFAYWRRPAKVTPKGKWFYSEARSYTAPQELVIESINDLLCPCKPSEATLLTLPYKIQRKFNKNHSTRFATNCDPPFFDSRNRTEGPIFWREPENVLAIARNPGLIRSQAVSRPFKFPNCAG
jgi:hypothetical protein